MRKILQCMLCILIILLFSCQFPNDPSFPEGVDTLQVTDSIPERIWNSDNVDEAVTQMHVLNNYQLLMITNTGKILVHSIEDSTTSEITPLPDKTTATYVCFDTTAGILYAVSENNNIYRYNYKTSQYVSPIEVDSSLFYSLDSFEIPSKYSLEKNKVELIASEILFPTLWNGKLVVAVKEVYCWEFMQYHMIGWKDTINGKEEWIWADSSDCDSSLKTENIGFYRILQYENKSWTALDKGWIGKPKFTMYPKWFNGMLSAENRLFVTRISHKTSLMEWKDDHWEESNISNIGKYDNVVSRTNPIVFNDHIFLSKSIHTIRTPLDKDEWTNYSKYYDCIRQEIVEDGQVTSDSLVLSRYYENHHTPFHILQDTILLNGTYRLDNATGVWRPIFEGLWEITGDDIHPLDYYMGFYNHAIHYALANIGDTLFVSTGGNRFVQDKYIRRFGGVHTIDLTLLPWYPNYKGIPFFKEDE